MKKNPNCSTDYTLTDLAAPLHSVRHVNVFATRNKFYDERWIEKQENGFRKWLNFVLTPPEGFAELLGGQADALGRAGKLDVAKIWQVLTWSLLTQMCTRVALPDLTGPRAVSNIIDFFLETIA